MFHSFSCQTSAFLDSKRAARGFSVQLLLREKCLGDEKLFSSFLNRLFNTLNWTITEFSVAIKEMQELPDHRQVKKSKAL